MARRPRRYQPEPTRPEPLTVFASLVKGRRMRRVLRLSGDLDVLLEYDGRLLPFLWHDLIADRSEMGGGGNCRHEMVRINGQVALALRYDSLYHDRHTLLFDLPTSRGWVRGFFRLSLSEGLRSQIETFQLSVDGQIAYEERGGQVRARVPVGYPIPSGVPLHLLASCPLVEAAGEAPPEHLPIPDR